MYVLQSNYRPNKDSNNFATANIIQFESMIRKATKMYNLHLNWSVTRYTSTECGRKCPKRQFLASASNVCTIAVTSRRGHDS